MTLDIRGSLKNTKLSSNKYVVIEELISNAIDSFLIRKHNDLSEGKLKVALNVEFQVIDLLNDQFDLVLSCTDNGCGLNDDRTNAFLTKDTSYKDDLAIAGIGKCKGAGRIQFFHHFSRVEVDSAYREGLETLHRKLRWTEGQKKIDLNDFEVCKSGAGSIGTKIRLANIKPETQERVFGGEDIRLIFSAKNIKRHILMVFLQRLVSLEADLKDFEIEFLVANSPDVAEYETLRAKDLPAVSSVHEIEIEARNPKTGSELGRREKFLVSHYKLNAREYELRGNAIALCAKSSQTKDITRRYLRTKKEQNSAIDGFHHIVLIEGDMLDRRVNEQRDDFEGIPDEIPTDDMFTDEVISYSSLFEELDPIIENLVSPQGWKREDVVNDVAEKFGLPEAMLVDTETRVVYGDTAKSVAERVLKKYQDRIIQDTADIFDLREEIFNAEPNSSGFRQKIHDLSWRYTSSLKNFDMANLSQLVVRRTAIVEILGLACQRMLASQATEEGRKQDESIIHNIFFPMRKDNEESSDHDIWLLSEEYEYYDYIASDMPLSKLKWSDSSELFEPDIDEKLSKILSDRSDVNGKKRPDIAIFSDEGSAIIIEFKAPNVSMDEHVGDLSEYAHLLAAKSGGRLKRFYGYLIGDTINRLRMTGYTRFPIGKGFFRSSPLQDPDSGQGLGELYEEVLFYEDIVDRARKRVGAYKERLNIDLSQRS